MHLRLSPSNTPTPGRATQPATAPWDKPEPPTSLDRATMPGRKLGMSMTDRDTVKGARGRLLRERLVPQLETANRGLPAEFLMLADHIFSIVSTTGVGIGTKSRSSAILSPLSYAQAKNFRASPAATGSCGCLWMRINVAAVIGHDCAPGWSLRMTP